MKVLSIFLCFLNRDVIASPFYSSNEEETIITGVSVTVILLIFQPFHLYKYYSFLKILLIILYTLSFSLIYLGYLFIIKESLFKFLKTQTIKVFQELFILIILIVTSTFLIYVFAYFLSDLFSDEHYSNQGLLLQSFYVSAIMLSVIFGVLKNICFSLYISEITIDAPDIYGKEANHKEEFKDNSINNLAPPNTTIHLYGANKSDGVYILKVANIIYIESQDKMVKINFHNEVKNQVKKIEIRQTLSELEKQFDFLNRNPFFRCQRSFIINLDNLSRLKGTSRNAVAVMKKDVSIPISREKYDAIRKLLLSDSYKK